MVCILILVLKLTLASLSKVQVKFCSSVFERLHIMFC